MRGFHTVIRQDAIENTSFRKVIYTGKHSQLVLMSLSPGEDIGEEVHTENDQFFRIEEGEGKCIIDETTYSLESGTAVVVPSGAKHNIINTSQTHSLKLYTIYSPPHHKDQILRNTKKDALENEAEFDGQTTE